MAENRALRNSRILLVYSGVMRRVFRGHAARLSSSSPGRMPVSAAQSPSGWAAPGVRCGWRAKYAASSVERFAVAVVSFASQVRDSGAVRLDLGRSGLDLLMASAGVALAVSAKRGPACR